MLWQIQKILSFFEHNGILFARLLDQISRTETKVGHSDPVILHGKVIDQQIKGTLGITG